jgi:hypothetical protein
MMYADTLKGSNRELALSISVAREVSQAKRRFSARNCARGGMIGSSQMLRDKPTWLAEHLADAL